MKRAGEADAAPRKRSKTIVDGEEGPGYQRFKGVRFPDAIVALPHVVKSIDVLLMTDVEAAVEAAGTGQMPWLRTLLEKLGVSGWGKAVVAAATAGDVVAVKALEAEFKATDLHYNCNSDLKYMYLTDAVCAAAKNGRLGVVKLLLPAIDEQECNDSSSYGSSSSSDSDVLGDLFRSYGGVECIHDAAWSALEEASEFGHLEVVKFTSEYAQDPVSRPSPRKSTALKQAIRGGHLEVVQFLVQTYRDKWDFNRALKQAVRGGQRAIIEAIYGLFPPAEWVSGEFFTNLAHEGNLAVIKYLYTGCNGQIDSKVVAQAFTTAAERERCDVLRFLHNSGLVSPETFDSVFECTALGGPFDIVPFLHTLQRVSARTIKKIFQEAEDPVVMELMLEKEAITAEEICARFRQIVDCEEPKSWDISVLPVLCNEKCISDNMREKAYKAIANGYGPDELKSLRTQHHISVETLNRGFVATAKRGFLRMVMAAFDDQQITPQSQHEALLQAVDHDRLDVVKFLLPKVSFPVQREAILSASHQLRVAQVAFMCTCENWSVDVLKEILAPRRDWLSFLSHTVSEPEE